MDGQGLDTANRSQGFDPIPAGSLVELVMKIKPGNVGIDGLCKRSSKGDFEGLDLEYIVKGGEFDKRKLYAFSLLDGVTAGQAKAGEITRSLLRAIFEAVNGIDPNDNSPATTARRAGAELAGFNGATFLLNSELSAAARSPAGASTPTTTATQKVLRPGDKDYRKLDQPPPAPIERSAPPAANTSSSTTNGSPAAAPTMIAKPGWAE